MYVARTPLRHFVTHNAERRDATLLPRWILPKSTEYLTYAHASVMFSLHRQELYEFQNILRCMPYRTLHQPCAPYLPVQRLQIYFQLYIV